MNVANLLCVLSLCGVLACSEDPHTILDACNLPEPCGRVTQLAEVSSFLFPADSSACIHDVLAQSAPAHFEYRTDSGGISRHMYTAGSGSVVLISTFCRGYDGAEPCDDAIVEGGTLRPLEEFECKVGCPQVDDCDVLGLQPSDFVCGFRAWLSDIKPIDPACP